MPNAIRAPSAAPPNALLMWTDGIRIYVELPGKEPYIVANDFTTAGLAKALSLLAERKSPYDYSGTIPKSYTGRNIPNVGTDRQHAIAEQLLRRKGVLR